MHRSLIPWIAVAALGAAACVTADDGDLGAVNLKLVGQAPSGALYRLRDATITISGLAMPPPAPVVFHTEDDINRMAVVAHVPAGGYTVDLADGWRLERVTGGMGQPVDATLTSVDPQAVMVGAGALTSVVLQFRVNGETVPMGDGDLQVTIGVDDSPVAPPPTIAFTGGPTPGVPSNDNTPTFTFAVQNATSFVCLLDGATLPCMSPFTFGPVADGTHNFGINATGANGVTVGAGRDFTVDTVGSVTTIVNGPPEGSVTNHTPVFEFVGGEPGTFECRVDGGFMPCASPFQTQFLSTGTHTFEVRLIDVAGNAGPVAHRMFNVFF